MDNYQEYKHLFNQDKKGSPFWGNAGHILATFITGGLYHGARMIHPEKTRGSVKFWQSEEKIFKEEAEKVGKQYVKAHKGGPS